MRQDHLEEVLRSCPEVKYGFCRTDFSAYADTYACALVFCVPYGHIAVPETYSEPLFEQDIEAARLLADALTCKLEAVLKSDGTRYLVPSAAQSEETKLMAPFSYKQAAVSAGLGWIGKNDVVITGEYGPRIRLTAILIDGTPVYGTPITESGCPDACIRCVDACPYGALTGLKWRSGMNRAQLIDYQLCNQMRSLTMEKLGRKFSCGLCMAACPYGIKRP